MFRSSSRTLLYRNAIVAYWEKNEKRIRRSIGLLTGITAGTSLLAIGQGSYLLYEYRKNHGMAPVPVMPSRGMVIVTADDGEEDAHYYYNAGDDQEGHTTSTNTTTTTTTQTITTLIRERIGIPFYKGAKQVQREKPPLRILVIGDSLAVGVGTSRSSTPVLPESIALSLSKAFGGRPVYWTCTGIVGCTASEIVDEIYQLEDQITNNDESHNSLFNRLQDWQLEMKIRANKRYEISKRKAKEWLEKRQQYNKNCNNESIPENHDNANELSETPEDKALLESTSRWKRVIGWSQRQRQQLAPDVDDNANSESHQESDPPEDKSSLESISRWTRFFGWIQSQRRQLALDIGDLGQLILPTNNEKHDNKHSSNIYDVDAVIEMEIHQEILLRKQGGLHAIKRRHSVDPNVVGKYDIAIVLTGLNDLKHSFLPFMVDNRKTKQRELLAKKYQEQHYPPLLISSSLEQDVVDYSTNDDEENQVFGLKRELLRITDALQQKMKSVTSSFPANNNNSQKQAAQQTTERNQRPIELKDATKEENPMTSTHSQATNSLEDNSYWYHDNSPIVVFPALPYGPVEVTALVPLRWFIIPLLRSIDHHKEVLAKMYPGLILYVDSPNIEIIHDAELRRGPLWDDFGREKIHLKITDVKQHVQETILEAMKQHYDAWIENENNDDDDDFVTRVCDDSISGRDSNETKPPVTPQSDTKKSWNDLYELDFDGVNIINKRQYEKKNHIGSTMVAPDGIHPSDDGYEMWGRHIANAIVNEMKRRSLDNPINERSS